MRSLGWSAAVAATLALSLCVPACTKKDAAPAGPSGKGGKGKLEFNVEVAPVSLRQVQYSITAPGTIQAFEQVQVTARVGGAVDKVGFSEGQEVKPGQVLAVIEVDRYQVAVSQAKATVDKANASEAQAEQQLARRQASNTEHPGLVPGEEVGVFQTSVQTAKADVLAAQQVVRVAELNLRDAYVRAPIGGVIQTRSVETGQYLQPGAVLATLLQRDPLLLKFSVAEQDAPRLQPGMTANLSLRESQRTYAAKITLVSAAADPTSHLVPVTAEIDDKEHKYWLRPGAFCDVSIPVGGTRKAPVIPELSVRASERGMLVYVVQGTTAHERVVNLGMHTDNGFVEITSGLNEGDTLVVRGAEPLSDGAPVRVSDQVSLENFDAGVSALPPPVAATPGAGGGGAAGGAAGGAHGHRDGGVTP